MPTRAQVNLDAFIRVFGTAKAEASVDKLAAATRRAQKSNQQLAVQFRQGRTLSEGYAKGIERIAQNLGKAAAAGVGLYSLSTVYAELIRLGVEWNKVLEIGALGIASVSIAVREYRDETGAALPLQTALNVATSDANKQLRLLRIAGLQTAATTRQLVSAYQESVGVGSAYALTLDQIRQITIRTTQAALTLGLPLFQINQEIRALLSGDIDRNARVAKALAITPEDVRLAQERNDLFSFLFNKLEAFAVAGERAQNTFAIITSNLQEAIETFAGLTGAELFKEIRDGLKDLTTAFFDLTTADIAADFKGLSKVLGALLGELGTGFIRVINTVINAIRGLSQSFGAEFIPRLRLVIGIVADLGISAVNSALAFARFAAALGGALLNTGLITGVLRALTVAANLTTQAFTKLSQAFNSKSTFALFLVKIPVLVGSAVLALRILTGTLGTVATSFVKAGNALKAFATAMAVSSAGLGQVAAFRAAVAGLAATVGGFLGILGVYLPIIAVIAGATYAIADALSNSKAVRDFFGLEEVKTAIDVEKEWQATRERTAELQNVNTLTDLYQSVLESLQDVNVVGAARTRLLAEQVRLERQLIAAGVPIQSNIEATTEAIQKQIGVIDKWATAQQLAASQEASAAADERARAQAKLGELNEKIRLKEEQLNATIVPNIPPAPKGRVKFRVRPLPEEPPPVPGSREAIQIELDGLKAERAEVEKNIPVLEKYAKVRGELFGAAMDLRTSLVKSVSDVRQKTPEIKLEDLKNDVAIAFQQTLDNVGRMEAANDASLAESKRRYDQGLIDLREYADESAKILQLKRTLMTWAWEDFLVSPQVAALARAGKEGRQEYDKLLAQTDKRIGDVRDRVVQQFSALEDELSDEAIRLSNVWSDLTATFARSLPLDQQIARVLQQVRVVFNKEIIALGQMGIKAGMAAYDDAIAALQQRALAPILDDAFDKVVKETQARVEEINQARESNAIGDLSARRRIAAAYRDEAVLLRAVRDALIAVGAADKTSVLNEKLSEVNKRLAEAATLGRNLDVALQDLSLAAREGLETGISDTLKKIGIEIKKLDEAFRNLALAFFTAIRDVAADLLAQEATERILGLVNKLKGGGKTEQADSAATKMVAAAPMMITSGIIWNKTGDKILASSGALEVAALTGLLFAENLKKAAIAMTVASTFARFSLPGFATGGYVRGPGTATSDSVPALLSRGEYVINAGAVQVLGRDYLDALNAINRPKIRRPIGAFAAGGLVSGGVQSGGEFGITIGLEEGLIARGIESRDGQSAVLKVLNTRRKNARRILN